MASDPTLTAAAAVGASQDDLNLIAQLQERVSAFNLAKADLQRLGVLVSRTNDNELWQQYGDLVARSESLQSKIQTATGAIDSAISYAKQALGLSAVRRLGQLGFVWLIPAAVIAAAVAALGYFLTDYSKFATRVRERARIEQELVSAGVDPSEAARQASAAVASAEPAGFLGPLVALAKYGVIFGVGWWLLNGLRSR